MSLNNESGSSMSFEELVNLNGEAMAVLDEVPYQPVVYAVPKEWLESWMTLLENAVRFQPTLYRQLTPLATQEEQQKLQVRLKADLEVAKREMLGELTALKKQDGNLKEKKGKFQKGTWNDVIIAADTETSKGHEITNIS